MAIRPTPFLIGQYYHIYNRGVDKRIIFLDDNDYKRFILLLYLCNNRDSFKVRELFRTGKTWGELFLINAGDKLVDIGAYCLMPNHFHILVHEKVEGGVSLFMQKLSTAYSMYFNEKYERKGSLFEGKFKSKHINNEPYFNWVFSYIHLNPVKLIDKEWKEKGISDIDSAKKFMDNYTYSSYSDYFVADRAESSILNKESFPEHFTQSDDFGDLVQEFRINNQNKSYPRTGKACAG